MFWLGTVFSLVFLLNGNLNLERAVLFESEQQLLYSLPATLFLLLIGRCVREGIILLLSALRFVPLVEVELDWNFSRLAVLFRETFGSIQNSSPLGTGRHLLLGPPLFPSPSLLPAVGLGAGTLFTVDLYQPDQFPPDFLFPADALLLQRLLRLRLPGGALQLAPQAPDDVPLNLGLDLLSMDQLVQLAQLLLQLEEFDHEFSMRHVVRGSGLVGPVVTS